MIFRTKTFFSKKMTPQTSNAVRESIIQWLQQPENFLLITGAAGFSSPVVSGTKLKKKDAYDLLAKFVNEKHKTTYSGNEMKRKYDWLLSQYKKANELSKTDTDVQKLEKKCPFYKELDILFKDRQNINPFNILEPIQIPTEPLQNDEENLLSSSLESVHITDKIKNAEPSSSRKRKGDNEEPESPKKKKEKSSEESPFKSKTSSGNNGKNNFTNSYVANQKERFKMEKEIKEEELKLQRDLKNEDLAFQKEKTDKELQWKERELEANIRLREKELEIQENIKKEEVKQTKMQIVKEMLSQGKSKDEIKEILDLLN